MDDAALIFCFRECSRNSFFNPSEAVSTENQDIFYTTVFQLIQNRQPVFRTFVISNLNGKDFLIQRPVLPVFNLGKNLICYIRNKSFGGFHHFLDGSTKKILKCILGIFSRLNIVFFQ